MWSSPSSSDDENDYYCIHYQSGTREVVDRGFEKAAAKDNGPATIATSSGAAASTTTEPDPRVTSEVNGLGARRWVASIEVPCEYHGYLIGGKAVTKLDMEANTHCRIIYPDREAKSSTVRVTSSVGYDNVACCLVLIEEVVKSAQNKSIEVVRRPFSAKQIEGKETTHFVALPLLDGMVNQRYITFVDMVLRSQFSHESCKVEALFPSRLKLHLTIGHLQIKTKEEKATAFETMSRIKGRHMGRAPCKAMIEGLVTYDNPARAHVVFAKLRGEGVQKLVDDIRNDFVTAGLVSREDKNAHVELQMVVMNSRYVAMAKADSEKVDFRDRTPFDVTTLLEAHREFDFAPITLDRVTICQIGSTDPRTGYYTLFGEEIID